MYGFDNKSFKLENSWSNQITLSVPAYETESYFFSHVIFKIIALVSIFFYLHNYYDLFVRSADSIKIKFKGRVPGEFQAKFRLSKWLYVVKCGQINLSHGQQRAYFRTLTEIMNN